MSTELFKLKNHKRDLSLGGLTCAELAQALAVQPDPNVPESAKLKQLREKIGPRELRLLRLCGKEPARSWNSKIRSAAVIEAAPTICSGTPRPMARIYASKVARRIAAANGIPLHNLKGRAAILVPQKKGGGGSMKTADLLAQVRRAGQSTRSALSRCQRRLKPKILPVSPRLAPLRKAA